MEIQNPDIYKIYILDSQGTAKKIILFSGGMKDKTHMTELFSDMENSEIVANQIEIVFSPFQIHIDDSIRIIKKKIIQELGAAAVSYEEIYMFAKMTEKLDMEKIYKSIVKKSKKDSSNIPKEFTKEQFGQFIYNLELADEISKTFSETISSDKEVYTYEDLLQLGLPQQQSIQTAIGLKFLESRDYLFSANPFDIRNISTSRFEISQENPLLTFENELLLNSGAVLDNTIYVCLAENGLDYAFTSKIDEEYVAMLYYPLLFSKGIKTASQLTEHRAELLRENAHLLTPVSLQIYKTVDMFYNIYNNKIADLPYADRGIQSVSLVINSGFSANIPLESIFKNIHATKQCPFIKFNPGSRRENMYRLYTEQVSKNGKKIPKLAESVITKLSRETGKGKQISLYLADQELYIDFENTGNIYVRSNFKKPIAYDALNEIMKTHVQPIIDIFNGILQQTGLELLPIGDLRDSHIEILNIKYVWSIDSEKVYSMKKYTSCISAIFNIATDDLTKEVNMHFKRVENFKEMDAQSELITTVLKNSNDYQEVVRILMMNYSITHEEAIIRVAEYTSENKELGGRILENPGFPVKMYYPVNQKKLVVEVDNIIAISYIDVLTVYIDSILRMLSGSDRILKTADVQTNCTKSMKITKDSDKSQFDNVMAVTGLSLIRPIKKIQPLTFDFDDDEVADEEVAKEYAAQEYAAQEYAAQEYAAQEYELSSEIELEELDQDAESLPKNLPKFMIPQQEITKPLIQQREETNSFFSPIKELPVQELIKESPKLEVEYIIEESPKESDDGFIMEEYSQEEQNEESPKEVEEEQNEESPKEVEEDVDLESPKEVEEDVDLESSKESDDGFMMEEYSQEDEEDDKDNKQKSPLSKGGEDTPSTTSSTPEQTVNIDGMSLHNFFLNRLKDRDEKLFLTKKEGQYSSYAKSCAANIQRQCSQIRDRCRYTILVYLPKILVSKNEFRHHRSRCKSRKMRHHYPARCKDSS